MFAINKATLKNISKLRQHKKIAKNGFQCHFIIHYFYICRISRVVYEDSKAMSTKLATREIQIVLTMHFLNINFNHKKFSKFLHILRSLQWKQACSVFLVTCCRTCIIVFGAGEIDLIGQRDSGHVRQPITEVFVEELPEKADRQTVKDNWNTLTLKYVHECMHKWAYVMYVWECMYVCMKILKTAYFKWLKHHTKVLK